MEALIHPEFGLIFWTVFIFALLVLILSKTVWKPLLKAIEDRESEIRKNIESAAKAKEDSEKIKKEIEEKLKGLKAEIETRLSEASLRASAEKDRVLAKAVEQSSVILENARREIESAREEAERELEKKVLEIAVLAGEKVLAGVADRKINSHLADALAKELASGRIRKVDS